MFLNVSELSGHSGRFGQRLREAVETALESGDEDLLTVDVARLFLDRHTEEMMDAFRRYCVRSVRKIESGRDGTLWTVVVGVGLVADAMWRSLRAILLLLFGASIAHVKVDCHPQ